MSEQTTDDLTTPLGQAVKPTPIWRRYRLPFSASQAVAALLGLVLLTFLGFAIFNDDPLGGEPMVRIAVAPEQPRNGSDKMAPAAMAAAPAAATMPKPPAAPQAAAVEQKTVTIIDGSSGARRDVTVPSADADS